MPSPLHFTSGIYRDMDTQILTVNANKPNSLVISKAANIIRDGELVAFPTETVYGLGANALDPVAVDRIFTVKERPHSDPIIVHVADLADLSIVSGHAPSLLKPLVQAFWPGPLTLVMPKGQIIPPNVTAGLDTVAVRMPSHAVALALIREAKVPIGAPSANLFGQASPTTAQHVWDDLAHRIPLILDAGPTLVGIESTVLDISVSPPVLLRPGGISLERIQSVVGQVKEASTRISEGSEGAKSPGLISKHYSPKAQLLLFSEGEEAQILSKMRDKALDLMAVGSRVGIMVADEDVIQLEEESIIFERLGSKFDLSQIAHRLFAAMRSLDRQEVNVILTRGFGSEGLGRAIQDRLSRAAGSNQPSGGNS